MKARIDPQRVHGFMCLLPLTLAGGAVLVGGNSWAQPPVPQQRVVAYTGMPAPGIQPLSMFQFFGRMPVINDAGDVAFYATVTGPNINAANDSALWLDTAGTIWARAVKGDPAPGVPLLAVYNRFEYFAMDSAGSIAYLASLSGPSINESNDRGIWVGLISPWLPVVPNLAAREGDPAPGTLTTYWELPDTFAFSAQGGLAFLASLNSPTVPPIVDAGIFSGRAGDMHLIARYGQAAPGITPRAFFQTFDDPTLGASGPPATTPGYVVFKAHLIGPDIIPEVNDQGIWMSPGMVSAVQLVARTGQAAPGIPGALFGELTGTPMVNERGQVVFSARLTGVVVLPSDDETIWLADPISGAAPKLVLRENDPYPYPSPTVELTYGELGQPMFNDCDVLTLRTVVRGPWVTPLNNEAIVVGTPGALREVARKGAAYPELADPSLAAGDGTAWFTPLPPESVIPRAIYATDRRFGVMQLISEGMFLPTPSGGRLPVVTLAGLRPAGAASGLATAWNDTGILTGAFVSIDGIEGVYTAALPPACLADIVSIGGLPPADGLLTGDDFIAFINAFAAADPLADVTAIGGPPCPPDGLITGDDFIAFINSFAAGCYY